MRMNLKGMNTSTAVVVSILGLAVVGTGGFLAYVWWKGKQEQQNIATVTTQATNAVKGYFDYQKAQAQVQATQLYGAGGVQILR